MKKTLILPDTIEACHELIISQARLIEQLERRAFGGSLKDRAVKYDGPSLFGEFDGQAKLEAAKEMEKVSKEIDAAAEKRRAEARAQAGGRGRRPEKYNTYGLPVQTKTVYPEGINLDEYDVIGQTRPTCCIWSRSAFGWKEPSRRCFVAKPTRVRPNRR